jgi:hypothetical protein
LGRVDDTGADGWEVQTAFCCSLPLHPAFAGESGAQQGRRHAPTTTVADRKEMIRQIIERVVVQTEGASERLHLTIE